MITTDQLHNLYHLGKNHRHSNFSDKLELVKGLDKKLKKAALEGLRSYTVLSGWPPMHVPEREEFEFVKAYLYIMEYTGVQVLESEDDYSIKITW